MTRDYPRLLPSIESLPAWTMSPLPWLLPSIESLPKWLPPLTELSREAGGVGRPCPHDHSFVFDVDLGIPPCDEE